MPGLRPRRIPPPRSSTQHRRPLLFQPRLGQRLRHLLRLRNLRPHPLVPPQIKTEMKIDDSVSQSHLQVHLEPLISNDLDRIDESRFIYLPPPPPRSWNDITAP